MCSIAGYFKLNVSAVVSDEFLSYARINMRMRGPDYEAIVTLDDRCTLMHQRLSIIDVSTESHQPMASDDGSNATITFNGEIYNYQELSKYLKAQGVALNTTSDTEVLLKGMLQEGLSFLHQLNGMFAFALYDADKQELTLVRDRFGVKPLHYMVQDEVVYFASHIAPLIAIKKDIRPEMSVYENFFRHTATDYDRHTFVEGIFQVEKGSLAIINKKGLSEAAWYQGQDFSFDANVFKSESTTLAFVEQLLVDAIRIRLRADVPICLTLSGGIDSTTIYTLIKEHFNVKVRLFTFIHPGSPTNEYEKVIKLAAEYDDYVCVVHSEGCNSFEQIQQDLAFVEFPIWGISTRAYRDMYEAIHQGGFKVVIEGHGSDEQLGGYPYMVESACYDYLSQGRWIKAFEISKLFSATQHEGLGVKTAAYKHFLKAIFKYWFKRSAQRSFQDNINWTFAFKILPIVLRAFDRLSMASSVESRAPFMDYRIVECFKQLPLRYKVNRIGNKAILRQILKKYEKQYIYEDKRKIGFSSDVKKVFDDPEVKKQAYHYIELFDLPEFEQEKQVALSVISQQHIAWSEVFEMSKVMLVAMVNEHYGIKP